MITIPKIANVTDIRYSWSSLIKEAERTKQPLLIVERSTPKAVVLPIKLAEKLLQFNPATSKPKRFQFRSYDLGKLKIDLTREDIYE